MTVSARKIADSALAVAAADQTASAAVDQVSDTLSEVASDAVDQVSDTLSEVAASDAVPVWIFATLWRHKRLVGSIGVVVILASIAYRYWRRDEQPSPVLESVPTLEDRQSV